MSDVEDQSTIEAAQEEKPAWQPLGKMDRRIIGVLVEKAKTTPTAYPLTVNSITTASNQKSNRAPLMNLEPDDVEQALDRLRGLGAIAEIQGDGRVLKYRHLLYQWLGVDKVEMAVMAELLLRGEQTLGDLRARAARMESIAGQAALRPVVKALIARNLMVALTPEGRGQMVTHNLYMPEELSRLKTKIGISDNSPATAPPAALRSTPASNTTVQPTAPTNTAPPVTNDNSQETKLLREEIGKLREESIQMRDELTQLREEVNSLKSELGV